MADLDRENFSSDEESALQDASSGAATTAEHCCEQPEHSFHNEEEEEEEEEEDSFPFGGFADDETFLKPKISEDDYRNCFALDITHDELATCVRVLSRLGQLNDSKVFRSTTFRDVREHATVIYKKLEEEMYDGVSREEYVDDRVRKLLQHTRIARLKQIDKRRIALAELRNQRNQALRQLLQPDSDQLRLTEGSEQPQLTASGEPAKEAATVEDVEDEDDSARLSTNLDEEDDEVLMAAALDDDPTVLNNARKCFICKRPFFKLHHFYDAICFECGTLNYEKRQQTGDLTGKVCLVTGGRVKIGYYCALKFLRAGARVIVTTRFPHDASQRFSAEEDYAEFKDRLGVYGLDMRNLQTVVRFCDMICDTYDRLDVIINNAAQTIRRPPAYYRHLMPIELTPRLQLPAEQRAILRDDPHAGEQVPQYVKLSLAPGVSNLGGDVAAPVDSSCVDEDASAASAGAGTSTSSIHSSPTLIEVLHMEDGEEGPTLVSLTPHPPKGSSAKPKQTDTSSVAEVEHVSAALSQVPVAPGDEVVDKMVFPDGFTDVTGQQLDLRRLNSWMLKLADVNPVELVEVFAINALAPFIINSRLKRVMEQTPKSEAKFIVNVSAMEGKFYRHKTPTHPHTNMAKAALNMMTRTSSSDYAESGIYMTSVDTGWINDEKPYHMAKGFAQAHDWQTPIDEVDAAARILDPVFDGYTNHNYRHGVFLKDYRETEW
eukprot:CAMPEP_0177671938 /NCGR_PEP_ID=MMETSP0447-20121125/25026_1 /TAXON_ID=0 /ORGANISM="Stygamoeba regulata, Strain BSH-02190019" /LENGTH=716 /DNA_ID=CAMNT_0019179475 /DNA_START=51 /DNA_END=2201 /DNA_ORIENTATION=+